MSAKELKRSFAAPAGKDPETQHEPADGPDEIWSGLEKGRYARSYDLLSDALMAIFEKIYLPLEVMDRNPETGGLRYTQEGLMRFEQLKDRYIVSLRNNEVSGLLEVEISPSPPYKGIFNTGIADPYLQGPAEIRNTITSFFTELNEIAAGLPGVRVSPSDHLVSLNGPQAFHDMIAALCEAKAIVTAEHDHVVYALNARKESCWNDSDEAEAPGYNTKPVHKILELSRNGRNDFASLTARYIQNNINSDDEELAQSAQIPEAVMHALSPQNYSWREIGHLVNRFNEEGIVPLFSLKTLQAAVDQDLGPENIKQRPAHYHLH